MIVHQAGEVMLMVRLLKEKKICSDDMRPSEKVFFLLHRKWRDPQFSWDKLYIVIYLKSNFDVVNNVRDCLLRYTVII